MKLFIKAEMVAAGRGKILRNHYKNHELSISFKIRRQIYYRPIRSRYCFNLNCIQNC